MTAPAPSSQAQHNQLALAIGAFVVCFALFGSVAAMMPALRERLRLSETQVGLVLAAPVLLGSIARVPVGILADRFGGKRVYLVVMSIALVPATLFPIVSTYSQALACACATGLTLSLFPVGVAFIASWYPTHRQGRALGLLTMGSLGHSLPMFAAPLVVASWGFGWGFWSFAAAAMSWMIVFATWGEESPHRGSERPLRALLHPLRQRISWVLSACYFLTFGCFLTLASFLPHLLTGTFGLSAKDAGFRAAGFVAATTWLAPLEESLPIVLAAAQSCLWCSR
jgi:MFS transporter, NNP family, nitrate/nitrite transporter